MGTYESRLPEDSIWCISKHLGGKYHAYEVLEKLTELAQNGEIFNLSRDLPMLASKKGDPWDRVWLRLVSVLDELDMSLEEYLNDLDRLEQLLNTARDLRRAVLVFRLDYLVWKAQRKLENKPAFESAILQEAMYVRDHLLMIEEHIVEVMKKFAFKEVSSGASSA